MAEETIKNNKKRKERKMKKLSGIFAVSMIAIMTAGAARADIASSKYVDDQVELRVATDQGVANAGKTMVVNAEGKVAPGTVSYDDLDNKPTIPAAQVNSDWNSFGYLLFTCSWVFILGTFNDFPYISAVSVN